MHWCITGGCGFIGRALIDTLLAEGGHQIRVYDNLSVGTLADLQKCGVVQTLDRDDALASWDHPLTLMEGDILDAASIQNAINGSDIVVHLAANTGVGPSMEDPMADCQANVVGVLNALEACRKKGVSRFVFASSGAPLGVQTPPLHEEMAAHPASPYGASKLAGEGYCSAYHHGFGMDTVVLRFGNVYGEGSTHKASVVAKFIKLALSGKTLEIYGDGSQTRDFIHISDLVAAVKSASLTKGVGGNVFQIATAFETDIATLTDKLVAALAAEGVSPPQVINGSTRDGDVARNFSDTSKAEKFLNWKPQVQLEDGLRQTVKFFLAGA